jgi:hypothetical protein
MRMIPPRRLAWAAILTVGLSLAFFRPAQAQDEQRRTKVPLIGKISGGSNRQAFSGKVQSVDLKRKLLMVGAVEGSHTEYFPVKKNVPVSSAGGEKMKVEHLAPGTNIIVYYEVKEDRRSVSEILVLGAADKSEAKKSDPPS